MSNDEINTMLELECPFTDGPEHSCAHCDHVWMILHQCFVEGWNTAKEEQIRNHVQMLRGLRDRPFSRF